MPQSRAHRAAAHLARGSPGPRLTWPAAHLARGSPGPRLIGAAAHWSCGSLAAAPGAAADWAGPSSRVPARPRGDHATADDATTDDATAALNER
jgi:hypothetical protein